MTSFRSLRIYFYTSIQLTPFFAFFFLSFFYNEFLVWKIDFAEERDKDDRRSLLFIRLILPNSFQKRQKSEARLKAQN